ncbi:MAG: membrane protein insertase YidC [Planctomycetes bacterium]|nr:membrane protein insertase YidC [Planctomycetota bacterium]
MAERKRKVDWVKYAGIALAILLFVGGQYYLRYSRQEQMREWAEKHPEEFKKWQAEQERIAKGLPPEDPDAKTAEEAKTAGESKTDGAKSPAKTESAGKTGEDEPKAVGGEDEGEKKPPADETAEPAQPDPGADVVITGGQLDITLSARGAAIHQATLATVKVLPNDKTPGLEFLGEIQDGRRSLSTVSFAMDDVKLDDIENRVWKLESDSGGFGSEGVWRVAYTTTLGAKGADGWKPIVKVTKRYEVPKEGPALKVSLQVENVSKTLVKYSYGLRGPAGVLMDGPKENPSQNYIAILNCFLAGRKAEAEEPEVHGVTPFTAEKTPDEEKRRISDDENVWAGVRNRFFLAMLVPEDARETIKIVAEGIHADKETRAAAKKNNDLRYEADNLSPVFYRATSTELAAGAASSEEVYHLYLGPAEDGHLEAFEASLGAEKPLHLDAAIQYCDAFGWSWPRVDWIARKLVWLFQLIHRMTNSYGLAVILLTLAVKLCLHPIQRKQTISMHMMQKLQPELQAIEKKYEGQTSKEMKQKKEMEKWDVMRKAGANPMTGCLPMFLQMPIFFALYGVFGRAFEIRHAGFWWIEDMAVADRLATLPVWPHELNLLPIVYLGMTLFQTLRMPKPQTDDPNQLMQRKLMMWFPLIIVLMFYRMPAGLVLYFACSASFGLVESWYIKRFILKVDRHGKPLAEADADAKNDLVPAAK